MTPHRNAKPPMAGGPSGADDFERQANSISKRPLAPYSRRLDPEAHNSIAVLTGDMAWERAVSPSCWFQGARLLLPFGENPSRYTWPVSGRDCILFSFGKEELHETLVRLSMELVQAGALFVIWNFGPKPALVFRGQQWMPV